MVTSLTRDAGVKIGPLLLETLVKHYFDRLLKDNGLLGTTKLRKDELLYDEAFNIVKTFMEAATKHPVEELQKFSNTRTPSPPWVRVVRLLVPVSCCDAAADVVIKALGGEEMTKRVVGGTKWWQVRGLKGVDAEWIAAKKDWEENERKYKAHEKERSSMTDSRKDSMSTDGSQSGAGEGPSTTYDQSMDEMRCILYAHGGGYYFGSFDQERYAIQRLARKINGRVFAINYRLAPQYPFPCGIQDIVAAYLFLIRPPEGAAHRPVKPEHIVVAGDSAGGGLCLALLQVLRDAGEPLPAGGVLISPWCDLTHSFPSIHTNTPTDVIPPYGLSFYKPSPLWPPPSEEMLTTVRETLRSRIRQAVRLATPHSHAENARKHRPASRSTSRTRSQSGSRPATPQNLRLPGTGQTLHLGSTASLPTIEAGVRDQTVHCVTKDGETLSIPEQIHLYTPNYLLTHPLVSPAVSYLGGLPPLFIIAGDGEVLRDEIIYAAHKAAHPDRFPIKPEAREMYPVLNGIEERSSPTQVHLQVYDDAAHVLPILFSFTTPSKYCFRAMALFIRQVTGLCPPTPSPSADTVNIPITLSPPGSPTGGDEQGQHAQSEQGQHAQSFVFTSDSASTHSTPPPESERAARLPVPAHSSPPTRQASPKPGPRRGSIFSRSPRLAADDDAPPLPATPPSATKSSFRRALSARVPKARSIFRGQGTASDAPPRADGAAGVQSPPMESASLPSQESAQDVGGPRFRGSGMHQEAGVRRAGEASVYQNGLSVMIRERVSTHGVIRPLEPEGELSAFTLPPELVGLVSELAMRRYHGAKSKFDKKFHNAYKAIEKHRRKHLERAQKDAVRSMAQLQQAVAQGPDKEKEKDRDKEKGKGKSGAESEGGSISRGSGLAVGWAWALDADERPPPSSIVARRDTHEAVELARIADQAVLADESLLSANSLWSLMANFLTVVPDKEKRGRREHGHERDHAQEREQEQENERENGQENGQENEASDARDSASNYSRESKDSRGSQVERFRSRFAQIVTEEKKNPPQSPVSIAEGSAQEQDQEKTPVQT